MKSHTYIKEMKYSYELNEDAIRQKLMEAVSKLDESSQTEILESIQTLLRQTRDEMSSVAEKGYEEAFDLITHLRNELIQQQKDHEHEMAELRKQISNTSTKYNSIDKEIL